MNRVLKLIRGESTFANGLTGSDIHIAVMDTGAFPHVAVKDRIVEFKDFQNRRETTYDDNGHGTHILGIIGGYSQEQSFRGIAPGCKFHVYKILNEKGNGKIQILTDAIWHIIESLGSSKIRIMNISIGSSIKLKEEDQKKLDQAIETAWQKGVVIVAAAGNNGPAPNTVTLPGINKRVITVGCSDDQSRGIMGGLRSGYSGVGPTSQCIVKPEILVPGTNIKSCGIRSEKDYCVKSGTSMAAPIVTGMIALLLEKHPELTPDEVKFKILRKAQFIREKPYCAGVLYLDELLR